MSITLTGITWDHSRALPPLVAVSQRYEELNPGISIRWEKPSLHEFGHMPVDQLADRFDFVIIDHPWSAYCAFAYSYGNYCRSHFTDRPLRYGDLVSLDDGTPLKSIIGGTGIAVTTRCENVDAALDYAASKKQAEQARSYDFAVIGPWISMYETYCHMRGMENALMDVIAEPEFMNATIFKRALPSKTSSR